MSPQNKDLDFFQNSSSLVLEKSQWVSIFQHVGVSENVVYPIVPNGFADHYPYKKWLFHWEY